MAHLPRGEIRRISPEGKGPPFGGQGCPEGTSLPENPKKSGPPPFSRMGGPSGHLRPEAGDLPIRSGPRAELFLKSENVQKFHCLIKEVYCKMSLVDLEVDKAHFTINFLN